LTLSEQAAGGPPVLFPDEPQRGEPQSKALTAAQLCRNQTQKPLPQRAQRFHKGHRGKALKRK